MRAWNKLVGLPSEPKPVRHIPIKQLGLATGQLVFVRVVKRKKIEVQYVGSE